MSGLPQPKSIAIMGATATGKSDLAMDLAVRLGGEIVSIDSRQVYIGMDIGTAKVPESIRRGVPHHLIDFLSPDEANSAGAHAALALQACRQIQRRRKIPILAGGTGLYFRAVFDGLLDLHIPKEDLSAVREAFAAKETDELYRELTERDPQRAAELSANDRMRITRALEVEKITGTPISRLFAEQKAIPPWQGVKIVLTAPREELRRRIAERTREMFQAGWVDEVKRLLDEGYGIDAPGMKSIGYGEIAGAIVQGADPLQTIDQVITVTRQYAKRQETFFRGEEDAAWIDITRPDYKDGVLAAIGDRT
ncbi:MAG: tRNA (adenosine(37)-N6)-dimethylallyltransferase MiaA [Candidatus Latescibacterota bacterium]